MTQKSPTLAYLQFAWPTAAGVLVLQSIAISWLGGTETIAAWSALLPILSGIVLAMGAAAGGGPLVADHIKSRASPAPLGERTPAIGFEAPRED
jgi:hypothetical protein